MDRRSSPDAALSGIFAKPGMTTGGVSMSSDGRRMEVRPPVPDTRLVSRLFIADVATGRVDMPDESAGAYFKSDFPPYGVSLIYRGLLANCPVHSPQAGNPHPTNIA